MLIVSTQVRMGIGSLNTLSQKMCPQWGLHDAITDRIDSSDSIGKLDTRHATPLSVHDRPSKLVASQCH